MDYLLEFGSREDVQALVQRFLQFTTAVQGIAVDLDDFWLASWRLNSLLRAPDYDIAQQRLFEILAYGAWPWPSASWAEIARMSTDPFVSYPFGIDTSWRPRFWPEYTSRRQIGDEPYVIKVILRPDASTEVYGLREINTEGYQVAFEPRPIARLYAHPSDAVRPIVGGVSVSGPSGAPGTLGGILTDGGGRRLGLTCAHVLGEGEQADQPSPRDNARAAAPIGTCIASSPLASHTLPLNAYDPASPLNEVDVAVVELAHPSELEILGVGTLSAIAPTSRVNPEESAKVAGKSGRRDLYIGSANLVHQFEFAGTTYGYKNLFELKRASRFWGLTGTLTPPVDPGDSGGWVLKDGSGGTEWLGVIVGGDGPLGYAVPAEFITTWLADRAGIQAVSIN
jgi:hypothetical protein